MIAFVALCALVALASLALAWHCITAPDWFDRLMAGPFLVVADLALLLIWSKAP